MNSSPWHVLHVLSNHEKKVSHHLAIRSVEHYLPIYSERVKWTDRTVVAERPLFAGYVFARFPVTDRRVVVSTPGVLRMLGNDERDMVSSSELDKIREGLCAGMRLRPHPGVTLGTRVIVREGVFSGVQGVVTELRHQCKVVITLSATQQCFSLEMQMADLEVLSKPTPIPVMHQVPAYMF